MKKAAIVLLASLILFMWPQKAGASDEISAKAAVVYEPFSGSFLYEKDADKRMLVASTTKILTAAVVLENCELDEAVEVSSEHASVEGSSMHLRPGESYTVEELLYGLMLASGNDAAAALAEHTAGSMEAFVELMNERCGELGLKNSHFMNSHGLDHPEHYSSARDLALITEWAMENEDFCRIFSTESRSIKGIKYTNHNKLLGSCPGCIGGKTGYTEKAGRILVSCVERSGMRLICVTVSDPRDWEDHKELYERCFEEYVFHPIPEEALQLPSASKEGGYLRLSAASGGVCVPKDKEISFRVHLPRFAFMPVEEGKIAGWLEIMSKGSTEGEIPLCYAETTH